LLVASRRPFKRDHNTIPINRARPIAPPRIRADRLSLAHAFKNFALLSQPVASGVRELDTGAEAGCWTWGVANTAGELNGVVVAMGETGPAESGDEVGAGNDGFILEGTFPGVVFLLFGATAVSFALRRVELSPRLFPAKLLESARVTVSFRRVELLPRLFPAKLLEGVLVPVSFRRAELWLGWGWVNLFDEFSRDEEG
jgi:hypothetical protein